MSTERIFRNAKVLTMDEQHPNAEAFVTRDGRFAAVGEFDEVRRAFPGAEEVDLGGRVILPGLIDAHAHLEMLTYSLEIAADCRSPRMSSIEDIIETLREAAESTAPGEWILGQGNHFQDAMLEEKRYPDRHDLDRVSDSHPVVYRASYHLNVFNSYAIRLLNITAETPDAPGGRIERDPETGETTGRTFDMYVDLGGPEWPVDVLRDGMSRVTQRYAAYGVTTVGDIPLHTNGLLSLLEAGRDGLLAVRVVAYPKHPSVADLEAATGDRLARMFDGLDPDVLQLGGIKLFLDGGLTSKAGALYDAYADDPENFGELSLTAAELNEIVKELSAAGHQVLIHATGDRALDMSLDALAGAEKDRGDGRPHRVEHAGNAFMTPERMARFLELDVLPVPQPSFILTTVEGYHRVLGPERTTELMPFRKMLDAGLRIPGNSDAIGIRMDQFSPFLGLYAAVTRRSSSGKLINEDQAVTVGEALRMYTRDAAYSIGRESDLGSIEAGKLADFIVLEDDPTEIAPEELLNVRVEETWLGGEVVWRAESPR